MNVGRINFNNSCVVSDIPSFPPVPPIYFETLSGKFSIEELVGKTFERRGEKIETRKIIDRTYSNKVCWSVINVLHLTPLEEFSEWLKNAKLIKASTE